MRCSMKKTETCICCLYWLNFSCFVRDGVSELFCMKTASTSVRLHRSSDRSQFQLGRWQQHFNQVCWDVRKRWGRPYSSKSVRSSQPTWLKLKKHRRRTDADYQLWPGADQLTAARARGRRVTSLTVNYLIEFLLLLTNESILLCSHR